MCVLTLNLKCQLYQFSTKTEYWQGLHDTIRITIHGSRYNISQYIAVQCILRYIAIFHIVHWKCKNRAEIQVTVYDLGSLHASHQDWWARASLCPFQWSPLCRQTSITRTEGQPHSQRQHHEIILRNSWFLFILIQKEMYIFLNGHIKLL